MKSLDVPYLSTISGAPISAVSTALNEIKRQDIDQQPWDEFSYKPMASFSIAHSGERLLIKYFVSESTVRALYTRPNEPVYKDSCVEFFVAFNNDKQYYNFEFNAIGTCKVNFGTGRQDRKLISDDAILKILFLSTISNAGSHGLLQWELVVAIPLTTFTEHRLESLHGLACRGNFYKCGDDLPCPHFLAWNNVTAPSPDFHVPKNFAPIRFL